MVMLRFWLNTQGNKATGNALERALRKCDREDIINKCIVNVELVTDESEKSAAKVALEIEETLSEREPSPFDQKQQYKDEIEDEPIMEHISDPIKQEICKDKELEDEDESKHAADELITEKIAKPLDLGEVEPRTLDETDFSFNKGADEIVLVLETHENPENLKMQGADTSVVEAAFLASQDLQESSSLDQTESPDDQKDSGASSKEDEPFEDHDDTKVNASAKDDANTPPPASSSNEPLNEE